MIYEMMAFLVTMYISVIIHISYVVDNHWHVHCNQEGHHFIYHMLLIITDMYIVTRKATYDIWNDGLPGYDVHVSNYQQHMIYEMMAFLVTMYMSVIINSIWYMKWWNHWHVHCNQEGHHFIYHMLLIITDMYIVTRKAIISYIICRW
jgi:hypothetical protein